MDAAPPSPPPRPGRPPGPRPERVTVFAAMKDEGPFIVEWLAWYRMLGFGALIAINDCTDRSPDLLDALARAGWCEVIRHDPAAQGLRPKRSAHRAARAHPTLLATDWMFVCDTDEFLVLREGDGTVGAFLDARGRDRLGHAIHWRVFGSSGLVRWSDAPVHRTFVMASRPSQPPNRFVKTLFRQPGLWSALSEHRPIGWRGGQGFDEARDLVDGEGRPLLPIEPPPVRHTPAERITHRHAQVNHYAVRWGESYGLKSGTASATAGVDRYTDDFRARMDRNDRRDLSALAYRDAFDRLHAEAMALPGVRALHHLCCADYVARLCARAGTRAEDDGRWRWHMAEAERG